MRSLIAVLALSLSLVGFAALAPTMGAGAATTDSAYELGTRLYIDCDAHYGYLSSADPDMQGGQIEVTIDGVRQPDITVGSGGEVQQSFPLGAGPHSISIVYDLVVGGTEAEQDHTLTVQCTPTGSTATTAPPTTNPPTTVAPTTTSTVAPTTSTTKVPCSA